MRASRARERGGGGRGARGAGCWERQAPEGGGRSPRLVRAVLSGAGHAREQGAEAWVGVEGGELQRAPEVLGVALAGLDGPLYKVEGGPELAAAGADAGEGGESGGVVGVGGDGALQDLLGRLPAGGRA